MSIDIQDKENSKLADTWKYHLKWSKQAQIDKNDLKAGIIEILKIVEMGEKSGNDQNDRYTDRYRR